MGIFVCVSVHHMGAVYADYLQKPVECAEFPLDGVTDGCEVACGGWKLNPCPLKEQPMFKPLIFLSQTSDLPSSTSVLYYRDKPPRPYLLCFAIKH